MLKMEKLNFVNKLKNQSNFKAIIHLNKKNDWMNCQQNLQFSRWQLQLSAKVTTIGLSFFLLLHSFTVENFLAYAQ